MSQEQPKPAGGNLAGFSVADAKKDSADVLPAGEYDLVIARCGIKRTTKGDYDQVSIEMKVLNGDFQNRTIFQHLSFAWTGNGPAPDKAKTACKIGRGTFAKICEAAGVPSPNDTADLVGKSFRAKLRVKQDDFGDKNVIAKATPRTAGSAAPAASAPAGVTGGKW